MVADYKTDALDAASAAQKARDYAPQLSAYARALQDAWGLESTPRTEVWLLRAGVIEPCPS